MTSQILIKLEMLELGILPARTGSDLIKMLESIPQEERRKFKRKFRKAWRKIAKEDPDLIVPMGLGSKNPTREQKMQRVARVYINASKEK
tara:strand:+ start:435 stop:704 length:270 start_codon:yes stop_codon:yes gene_type:complete